MSFCSIKEHILSNGLEFSVFRGVLIGASSIFSKRSAEKQIKHKGIPCSLNQISGVFSLHLEQVIPLSSRLGDISETEKKPQ